MTTLDEPAHGRRALLVDFGVAVKITAGQQPYWGTISTASDAVLEVLARLETNHVDPRHHEATASDDLVALVRSIAQILFPKLNAKVRLTAATAVVEAQGNPHSNVTHIGIRARLLRRLWGAEIATPVAWPHAAVQPFMDAINAAQDRRYDNLKVSIRLLYNVAAFPDPWSA